MSHIISVQLGTGSSRRADGEAEEDGDDVHQLVAGGLGQTLNHTGLLEEVAEHEAGDQRSGGGNEQRHNHKPASARFRLSSIQKAENFSAL